MIAWLTAVAFAQDEQPDWFVGACDIFQPVAGTAGFVNAIDAIRTNATTYSAGEFARRRLRGQNYLAMDFHVVAGAARVPAWCTGSGYGGRRSGEMYFQPLDLGATNFGIDAPLLHDGPLHSSFQLFYASSVTQSNLGARALSWVAPLMNLYPAVGAPLLSGYSNGRGLFTYAVDWIGGAYLQSDVVSVQAGYTGSEGLYLDVTQEKIALFANTVFGDGIRWTDASYLLLGVDQFDPRRFGNDDERFGMTTAFYRDLPSGGTLEAPVEGVTRRVSERLRTGHLRQEDIGRLLDVRTAYEFGERFRLRELAVAVHTKEWWRRPDQSFTEERNGYLRVGFVHLPDQPLLGVKGGIKPTLRGDYTFQLEEDDVFALRASARMNDPDLLDLYPFAYNALGINVELTYIGEAP